MEEHAAASGGSGLSLAAKDESLLLELLHDHGTDGRSPAAYPRPAGSPCRTQPRPPSRCWPRPPLRS